MWVNKLSKYTNCFDTLSILSEINSVNWYFFDGSSYENYYDVSHIKIIVYLCMFVYLRYVGHFIQVQTSDIFLFFFYLNYRNKKKHWKIIDQDTHYFNNIFHYMLGRRKANEMLYNSTTLFISTDCVR